MGEEKEVCVCVCVCRCVHVCVWVSVGVGVCVRESKVHQYRDLAMACASSHQRRLAQEASSAQRGLSSSTNCYEPKPLTGRTVNLM